MRPSVNTAICKDGKRLESTACVPSRRKASRIYDLYETDDGFKLQTSFVVPLGKTDWQGLRNAGGLYVQELAL